MAAFKLSHYLNNIFGHKIKEETNKEPELDSVSLLKENPWKITLEDDPVVIEEEPEEVVSAKTTISQLLLQGQKVLEEMHKIIEKSNCEEIPLDTVTDNQTFTYKEKRYIIKEKALYEELQHLFSQTWGEESYDKIISKRNIPLFQGLQTTIIENLDKLTSPLISRLIKATSPSTIGKLIINVLSVFIRRKLERKDYNFEFRQQVLGNSLGEVIIIALMHSYYLYYDTKIFNGTIEGQDDANDVSEYAKRDDSELKKLLKALNDPVKWTPEKLINTYSFLLPEEFIMQILKPHLELHCLVENIIPLDLQKKYSLEVTLSKKDLDLGTEILSFLKEIDIVEFFDDNRGVPYVKVKADYECDIFASATYFKPLLYLEITDKRASTFCSKEQFKFNIMINNDKIPNKSYIHVTPEKTLYDLIHTYDEAKYECNDIGFSGLLELLETMKDETDTANIIVFMDFWQ